MLAIIGGTGLAQLAGLEEVSGERVSGRWGESYLETGTIAGQPVCFLPRHGHPPAYPPHKINYRANIDALRSFDVTHILAVTAVGSVDPALPVGGIVMPDQIIDYTWGRAHTFFDDEIHHIDYTWPYDEMLRSRLGEIGRRWHEAGTISFTDHGVYGCTQGPRLETAAEIQRMYRDGCHIVGMTAMPEAPLAREADIAYVGLSLIVNAGAGLNDQAVALDEIEAVMQQGMTHLTGMVKEFLATWDYSA
ncbi:MAG: S-methyl-5'-thioinosine phosphorylase [Pseudomonadales bacterium]|nr:S-methyl-5'-thioinosine phosphorylase [Pseudomonadales bacterium]